MAIPPKALVDAILKSLRERPGDWSFSKHEAENATAGVTVWVGNELLGGMGTRLLVEPKEALFSSSLIPRPHPRLTNASYGRSREMGTVTQGCVMPDKISQLTGLCAKGFTAPHPALNVMPLIRVGAVILGA